MPYNPPGTIMLKSFIFSAFFLLATKCLSEEAMNQASMEAIVKEIALAHEGGDGFIKFVYKDVPMFLISDVTHNRMRVISPIKDYAEVEEAQLHAMMVSNFHLALDARYAVSEDVLYSVYVHPMSGLSKDQIISAVDQVANLALSFGTDYSSGALSFGGGH